VGGTKLGYVLGLLKYSRGKEAEADRLGLEVMNAAGYDPNEMAVVFRKLADQERSLPSSRRALHSSHPLSEDPDARGRAARRDAAAPRRRACCDRARVVFLAGEPDVREGLMARVLVLALLVAACGVSGPVLDPDEHVAGERTAAPAGALDRLWPAILGALPAEGLRVAHQDRARGAIATAARPITGGEAQKKLAEIGDLARATQAGIQRVSELEVGTSCCSRRAGDAGTRLRVRSTIDAIDRSAPAVPRRGASSRSCRATSRSRRAASSSAISSAASRQLLHRRGDALLPRRARH
jgi:hypothetical protein